MVLTPLFYAGVACFDVEKMERAGMCGYRIVLNHVGVHYMLSMNVHVGKYE